VTVPIRFPYPPPEVEEAMREDGIDLSTFEWSVLPLFFVDPGVKRFDPDQPRDSHGRWTDRLATDVDVGKALYLWQASRKIPAVLREKGGFTFTENLQEAAPERYVSAVSGHETRIPLAEVNEMTALGYVLDKRLDVKPGMFVGGWVAGDDAFFDISTSFDDLDNALSFGCGKHHQLAIWDSVEMIDIPCPEGEKAAKEPTYEQRVAGMRAMYSNLIVVRDLYDPEPEPEPDGGE